MKIEQIDAELSSVLQQLIDSEALIDRKVSQVHPEYKLSAKNLYRYLMLRSFDLRKYHDTLSEFGISSLRTTEEYVLSNLYHVIKNLRLIQGISFDFKYDFEIIGYKKSKLLLKKHANKLFNERYDKNFTEIMVTLPEEAADDKSIIKNMVLDGMGIARINLSHGDIGIWTKMVEFIHEVQKETNQKVKIYMDLSGPKIRTAAIEIHGKKDKVKDKISIKVGDHIILTKRDTSGRKSKYGKHDEQTQKAEVGVSLHQIIDDAKIGDIVLLDDGMINTKVTKKRADEIEVEITACYKTKLGSNKGINLPNTTLNLPALTNKDLDDLTFICKHADMVGYSFVRTGADVKQLYTALENHHAGDVGVIFKIENEEAFNNLPEILLEGMTRSNIGVMIARGDLAVEIGFERISEVQSEILWLCEAAHIPVIWATQVLENLVKTGIPTRAEISDAAQGAQAECVMLNKGPYINEAISVLKNVLIRMEEHSYKKKNELRILNVAHNYLKKMF